LLSMMPSWLLRSGTSSFRLSISPNSLIAALVKYHRSFSGRLAVLMRR
jgi:hypothetical protein